ncbi:Metridin-like ShK toxin [Macleaya cordata]|uniref:procollagen-proline 4-dioxygenase n=1 Tax=Macleaya cordata TaxID=56857 RepID=A0A200QUB8_MACCD|nr:Metridin-like ShK toxin [Macleaya cordata]
MASLLSVSISLILVFICSLSSSSAESYRKELRTKSKINQQPVIKLVTSTQPTRIDPSRVIQLSWRPRVFLYGGFLSDEECDHLISLGHGKLEKSLVENRNSHQDDIVARIEDRISAWTFLPKENSEHLQIQRYIPEDTNQLHNYYGDKDIEGSGLMATVVLFLSNVTRGGETLFLDSELKNTQPKDETWSDCSKTGFAVKPLKGNALLFFHVHPNTSPDNRSSHSRCPLLEGEKWCATKNFHMRAIEGKKVSSESDSSDCTDEDDNCARWAALGECQRNPVYMAGTPDYYGTCRKSCNVC